MIRFPLALAALLAAAATPASATERKVGVGSFDRVRINGPFEVVHAIGSPSARVSGDARVIENVEVRVDGATLTIRMSAQGWGERPAAVATTPVVVTLTSPSLAGAAVFAGGRLNATRMKGPRIDLSVSGSGAIAVADATGEQLNATLIGAGAMTLAGRVARARLTSNGPGRIDAAKLDAGDLSVLLDGPGETRAAARYNAQVTNSGLGRVTIDGAPKCAVSARGGGPVSCGR